MYYHKYICTIYISIYITKIIIIYSMNNIQNKEICIYIFIVIQISLYCIYSTISKKYIIFKIMHAIY